MQKWIAAALLLLAASAPGQEWAGQLSGGYSQIHFKEQSRFGYPPAGTYIDGELLARVVRLPVPVWLGSGFSWTEHAWADSGPIFSNPFFLPPYKGTERSYLRMYSLEGRVEAPLAFPGGLFIIPRFGVGIQYTRFKGTYFYSETVSGYLQHSRFSTGAFEARPGIAVGYAREHLTLGADVTYMVARGHFGPFGHTEQELRAGLFLRYTF